MRHCSRVLDRRKLPRTRHIRNPQSLPRGWIVILDDLLDAGRANAAFQDNAACQVAGSNRAFEIVEDDFGLALVLK